MATRDIIVLGGSTGAIEALQRLCADLPADLPAAVFSVLHVGHGPDLLASMLDQAGPLPAVTAEDGVLIERGKVYVAPADHHLILADQIIRLGRGPRENLTRPAIDPLFRSAAVSHGPRVIGVVLTGLLNDGAAGLAAVKQCGGVTVVQNPSDAKAADMPLSALRSSDVDYRAPVAELGALLAKLAREPAGPFVSVPSGLTLEVDIALGRASDTPTLMRIADPVALSCPSCGGVLSELRNKPPMRFRCQVGHAFTAEVLDQQKEGSTDEALRVALRIIEERATLTEKMATDSRGNGRHKSAAMLEARSKEFRRYAEVIRKGLIGGPD